MPLIGPDRQGRRPSARSAGARRSMGTSSMPARRPVPVHIRSRSAYRQRRVTAKPGEGTRQTTLDDIADPFATVTPSAPS